MFNSAGQDVSDKDVLAARANATFVWGESSKLRVLADTIQDNSNAAGGQRLNNLVQPALNDRFDQRTDMPVDRDRFISKGAAATYTQTLSDAFDLKLVGAYREGDGRQFIDFEELNANLFQVPAEYSDNQASGEAQLTYTSDKLKGVTGVYYFDGTARGAFDASLGANNLTALTKGSVRHGEHRGLRGCDLELDRQAEPERGRALESGQEGSDGVRCSSTSAGWPPIRRCSTRTTYRRASRRSGHRRPTTRTTVHSPMCCRASASTTA